MKLSDKIIKIGEFMYRVYPFKNIKSLELGNAYTFTMKFGALSATYNWVLPFRGYWNKGDELPGIYLDKYDEVKTIFPTTSDDLKLYHTSRIFEITPETISTELDQYLSEVDVTEYKYTGNLFQPQIKETDDTGIKGVRIFLTAKEFDFNAYANKFEKSWDRANVKKALEKDSTLTFSKLNQYAEIFDFGYALILFDKDGAKDPVSKKGKAMVIYNDEIYEIDDDNLVTISSIEDIRKLKE